MISQEGEELKPAPADDHTDELVRNLHHYAKVGHAGAEVCITQESVTAMFEGRRPTTDVYYEIAYCHPDIYAFYSANKNSEWVKVPDFGWHTRLAVCGVSGHPKEAAQSIG
jgi:hypothetical protein